MEHVEEVFNKTLSNATRTYDKWIAPKQDGPLPTGDRVFKCRKLFLLTDKDIGQFWSTFKRFDYKKEGFISYDTFFTRMVHDQRTDVGNAIFELVDAEDRNRIEFGEFMQGMLTFCCLSPAEMLKFAFMAYDKDKSGVMDMEELHYFIKVLHSGGITNNVHEAMSHLQLDDFGRLHFDGFKALNRRYPQVLYPVFRLQQNCMLFVMGQRWWTKKIAYLDNWRRNKREIQEKKDRNAEAKNKKDQDRQIRKVMGWTEYYMKPKKRQIFASALNAAEDEEDDESEYETDYEHEATPQQPTEPQEEEAAAAAAAAAAAGSDTAVGDTAAGGGGARDATVEAAAAGAGGASSVVSSAPAGPAPAAAKGLGGKFGGGKKVAVEASPAAVGDTATAAGG